MGRRRPLPDYIHPSGSIIVRLSPLAGKALFGVGLEPGFEGVLTLDLLNQSTAAVALYPGIDLCQVAPHALSSPAEVPDHGRTRAFSLGARTAVAANPGTLFPR